LWVFAMAEEQASGGWRTAARKMHTGSDGAVRLPWSKGESLAVSLFALGFAEIARTGVQSGLSVTLGPAERGREALVRVVDEEGRPVPGALLRAGPQAWPVARTDADGAARCRVPAGASTVLRIATADGRGEIRKLAPESATAEIRLPGEPRFLAGRVVEAGSQAPLGGALL